MYQNPKRKELFNIYVRTKITYKKYQIYLVELSNEHNMKGKYPYLFPWVNHFSKVCVGYSYWELKKWNYSKCYP